MERIIYYILGLLLVCSCKSSKKSIITAKDLIQEKGWAGLWINVDTTIMDAYKSELWLKSGKEVRFYSTHLIISNEGDIPLIKRGPFQRASFLRYNIPNDSTLMAPYSFFGESLDTTWIRFSKDGQRVDIEGERLNASYRKVLNWEDLPKNIGTETIEKLVLSDSVVWKNWDEDKELGTILYFHNRWVHDSSYRSKKSNYYAYFNYRKNARSYLNDSIYNCIESDVYLDIVRNFTARRLPRHDEKYSIFDTTAGVWFIRLVAEDLFEHFCYEDTTRGKSRFYFGVLTAVTDTSFSCDFYWPHRQNKIFYRSKDELLLKDIQLSQALSNALEKDDMERYRMVKEQQKALVKARRARDWYYFLE